MVYTYENERRTTRYRPYSKEHAVKPARPGSIDERLVRALAHPVRIQILEILSERVASPNMLALELETGLSHVAYHTRVLDRCGCLDLIETAQRRGATEHFYRAHEDTTFSWMPLDLDEQ